MLNILASIGVGLVSALFFYVLGIKLGREKETEQELTDYGSVYVLNNVTHSRYDAVSAFIVNVVLLGITSMAFLKFWFSMKVVSAIGLGAVATIAAAIILIVIGTLIVHVGKLDKGLSNDESNNKIADIAIVPCCLASGAMVAMILFQFNLF